MTPASLFLTDRMRICSRAEAVLTAILTAPLKETGDLRRRSRSSPGVLQADRGLKFPAAAATRERNLTGLSAVRASVARREVWI